MSRNSLKNREDAILVVYSKPNDPILQSASYKAGMEDIKNGNVTSYSSSDEMFRDLMK